jgi:hypothetical protein
MAFADWDQVLNQASSTATLNSSLANPLTIGSDYCRRLFADSQGSGGIAQGGATLKSTYASGAFYGVPNNRALRVQAYLRASNIGNANNSFCLGVKIPNGIGANLIASAITAGYAFGLRGPTTVTLYTNQVATDLPDGGLGPISLNTWYGFRLEVFPLGTAADRIMCYRESSPGSGTWVKINDEVISAASNRYVPWSNDRKTGFSSVNRYISGGATNAYIDLFDASLATAPTPIP